MPIQIRRARPADANQLVAVIQTAFNEPADTAQIATCIAVADRITFVALVDRRVVGFLDGLYVASAPLNSCPPIPRPAQAHLLAIDTLTYRGIWLAGAITAQAIQHACQQCTAQERDIVGAMLALDDPAPRHLMTVDGFQRVGQFQWWRLDQRSL